MRAGTDLLTAIRPLARRDRDPLEGILRRTGVFSAAEIAVAMELIDAVLGNPSQRDYVAFAAESGEGGPAGYYCIGPTPMTAGTWDLYWIAVDPDRQGGGTGAALLRHAEEHARARGAALMVAETSSKPSYDGTHRFYRSTGYRELARIPDYYAAGDDLVVYGKYFSTTSEG